MSALMSAAPGGMPLPQPGAVGPASQASSSRPPHAASVPRLSARAVEIDRLRECVIRVSAVGGSMVCVGVIRLGAWLSPLPLEAEREHATGAIGLARHRALRDLVRLVEQVPRVE